MSETKCEDCGKPTDLKGWYFKMPKGGSLFGARKKSYHWWCNPHFLIHMFNLYPYKCTTKCLRAHNKATGVQLKPEDALVWIDLSSSLVPFGKPDSFGSVAMKSLNPRCPWCQKPMKLAGEYFPV